GEVVGVEHLCLQRPVAEGHLGTERAARGERHDLADRKAAFFQNVEHFAAHIARGADYRNLETHSKNLLSLSALLLGEPAGRSGSPPPWQTRGEGEQAKGDQTVVDRKSVV